MKYFMMMIVGLFFISACSDNSSSQESKATRTMTFICQNDTQINVNYRNGTDHIQINLNGMTYNLTRVRSGSGEKYSNGIHKWWSKGPVAFFEKNDRVTIKDCILSKDTL